MKTIEKLHFIHRLEEEVLIMSGYPEELDFMYICDWTDNHWRIEDNKLYNWTIDEWDINRCGDEIYLGKVWRGKETCCLELDEFRVDGGNITLVILDLKKEYEKCES